MLSKLLEKIDFLKIKTKIIFFFVFLVVIIALVNMSLVFFVLNKTLTAELLSRALLTAESLKSGITDLLIAEDKGALVKIIFDEKFSRKDIEYIAITDKNNNLTASTFTGNIPERLLAGNVLPASAEQNIKLIALENNNEVYDIALALAYDKGTLRVGYQKKQIDDTVDKIMLLLLVVMLAPILIAILLAPFLSKIILRPLGKLKDTVLEISSGNLNQRVEIKSNDEIEQLAVVFNQMLDNIEKMRKEAAKQAEKRAQELKAKAEELKAKMEELEKFNKLIVGRELRMVELKKEIEELKKKVG